MKNDLEYITITKAEYEKLMKENERLKKLIDYIKINMKYAIKS